MMNFIKAMDIRIIKPEHPLNTFVVNKITLYHLGQEFITREEFNLHFVRLFPLI
jgi:hypothetical protein